MDVTNLLVGLNVELAQLLASGVLKGLLEVVVQAGPGTTSLAGDLVALV